MGKLLTFRRRHTKRSSLSILGGFGFAAAGVLGFTAVSVVQMGTVAAPADGLYVSALRKCYEGERNSATKTCVVDGDTVWLHGTDYRLKEFDTPEPQTNICGGAAEIALANKASARLLQLLNSNRWTIETFGVDNTGRRILATIRVNGRDVGDVLIAERLARRWPDGDEWWCRL